MEINQVGGSTYSPNSNTDLKIQMVRAYTSCGFTLFPLTTSTKKPKYEGWRYTQFKPDLKAHDLPKTYGVILNDEIMVLDIDPRRYHEGRDDLADFVSQMQVGRQETFIVETGSGGFHIYFKKPAGIKLKSKVPGFPSIDIKSGPGHYVIAAGSIHQNGNEYKPARLGPDVLAPCPQAILEHCQRTQIEISEQAVDDSESTQERFKTYIKHSAPKAISGQSGNSVTFQVACQGKTYGLSESVCLDLMLEFYNTDEHCEPTWDENELLRIVHNAYQYSRDKQGSLFMGSRFQDYAKPLTESADEHIRWDKAVTKDGIVLKATLPNVLNYMRLPHLTVDGKPIENPLKDLLRYNVFSREIEFKKRPPWMNPEAPHDDWRGEDAVLMKGWLNDVQHFDVEKKYCVEASVIMAHKEAYHPVKAEFEALPKWDGVNRLEFLFVKYAGVADSAYARAVAKCWMISAIARIYEPGCKCDYMPVLEGLQGIKKSAFCEVLGGKHFSDMTLTPGDRDTFHGIQSKWIIEIAEMKFNKDSEIDALKKFITSKTDRARLAYEPKPIDLPRQCVFIGTINTIPGVGYLKDQTGNRRFWPMYCTKILIDELQEDREQILAEALHRYRQGEDRYFKDEALIEAAREEQEARREADGWEESIRQWIARQEEEVLDRLTSELICYAVLGLTPAQMDGNKNKRLNMAMCRLGFEKRQKRVDGERIRVWASSKCSELLLSL